MKVNEKNCANKECGLPFKPRFLSTEKVCSFACASAFAKQVREEKESKDWKSKQREMRSNLKTKSEHEKDLQKIFNEFIRLRDKDEPCITCPSLPGTFKINAGHYFPVGSYKNLRFDEDNVHNQCVHCNLHKHGNISEYSIHLPERIGQEAFDALQNRRNEPKHYSIPDLIELKVIYKDKVKELKRIR